jgi:hypothetical protein
MRDLINKLDNILKESVEQDSGLFEIGDEFGISFSEDLEIGTTIVGFVEDGIVVELDETATSIMEDNGARFIEGYLEESVAGAKKCWKGYRKVGTQPGTGKNAGKRVNDCKKIGEDSDIGESGLQYHTGKKKYGKDGMTALSAAGRDGASEEELGRIKDKYKKEDSDLDEAAKKGLYYNVNKRKKAGTSRPASSPKAPTAQAWKDAAKTAKKEDVSEAEYQGREVTLNKPTSNTDGKSKSKVYVKDPQTGNVKKVTFGDANMRIKKSNPERRKSFRARHNCDNPGPKTKARYWSCRAW